MTHAALTYTGPVIRHVAKHGRSIGEDARAHAIEAAAVFYRRVLVAKNVVERYGTSCIPP